MSSIASQGGTASSASVCPSHRPLSLTDTTHQVRKQTVIVSRTSSAPTSPVRILLSIPHLERSTPLPRPTPPISMSPMPASPISTRQTPLTSILSLEIHPLALAHSPISKNPVHPPLLPGLSSAGPTLPSTRTIVVSQHPWNLSPSPLISSWTILRRRRRTQRSPPLVSGMPPLELDSLMSNWKNRARTQRPPVPAPTEIAFARCILAQLLPLPQLVDPRIVYLPLASRLQGGRGKPRMTRKASLAPIKDLSMITYLPEFHTDELALQLILASRTCIYHTRPVNLIYISTLLEVTSHAGRCSTRTSLYCVNILVNRYNVDPPRRFVSPTY
jgi:hypothetical protein